MNHNTDKPGPGDPDRQDGHELGGAEASGAEPHGRDIGPGDHRLGDHRPGDGHVGHSEYEGAEPGGVDEEALRRLLHHAVDELEPAPGSLDHLRRAVPARRTRRRQVLVGAVAAVVLGGAALPALVHVATTGGGSNDHSANASSSHRTPGVSGGQHGGASGGADTGRPSDKTDPDKGDKGDGGKGDHDPSKDPKGGSGGSLPDPSGTLNATSPTCSRTQLSSKGAGSAGAADAEGRIYGSFRVVNTSDRSCTVEGGGVVNASAQSGADSSRIFVVDHTTGDAASGLPDPATQPGTVILQPGQAYQVRFAWIPASGGSTSGCSNTGSTPTADPTTDAGDSAGGDGASGDPGGSPGGGGDPSAASVLVSHTPEAGDPAAASVTLGGACAGTIYRTGPLTDS